MTTDRSKQQSVLLIVLNLYFLHKKFNNNVLPSYIHTFKYIVILFKLNRVNKMTTEKDPFGVMPY